MLPQCLALKMINHGLTLINPYHGKPPQRLNLHHVLEGCHPFWIEIHCSINFGKFWMILDPIQRWCPFEAVNTRTLSQADVNKPYLGR